MNGATNSLPLWTPNTPKTPRNRPLPPQRRPAAAPLLSWAGPAGDGSGPAGGGQGARGASRPARSSPAWPPNLAVYATRAFGPGTQRAYRSAWGIYTGWCAGHGLDPFAGAAGPLPLYVTHLAETGRAVASIRVALAAIATAYRLAGRPLDLRDPLLAPVIEGVTRTLGSRPRRQAAPAVPEVLRVMLASCGRDEILKAALAARDRAMLLLGFGAALRRSELVALTLEDAEIVPGRGVRVRIRRSKTDQQGRGQEVAIWANLAEPDFCPLVALETWLKFRARGADMAGAGRMSRRPAAVRRRDQGRENHRAGAVGQGGGPAGEGGGGGGRPRSGALCRAFAARGPGHRRRGRRNWPRRCHAPDPPSIAAGRLGLSPAGRSVAQ